MNADARNKLADRLNEAINIISDVSRQLQDDPTSTADERKLGREIATTHISALGASHVILRNLGARP